MTSKRQFIVAGIRHLRQSELARNISKVYAGDILARLMGVVTAVLLIRGLRVDDYAAYTAFTTVLFLFPSFVSSGVNQALIRFASEHISRTGRRPLNLYLINMVFQIALYTLVCVLMLAFSGVLVRLLFGGKDFKSALQMGLVAGMGFVVSQSCRSVYQAEEKFVRFVRALWLRQIMALVTIAVLSGMGCLTIMRVTVTYTFIELAVGGLLAWHVFRGFRVRAAFSSFGESLPLIKEFFSATGLLITYGCLLTAFQSLDIFMLAHFSSEVELANYGVAGRYYAIALLLLGSIHAVLLPRFSQVDMRDPAKQRRFALRWLALSGWTIVPILAGVVIARPLYLLVNGIQYENSYIIFLIFSVGVWISLALSPVSNVLKARKAFGYLVMLALVALIANVTGNFLLIPLYGARGAAAVTVCSSAIVNVGLALRVFLSTR